MGTLTVYDAQGNKYSPAGDTAGTSQRIKQMALASMRVAIEPDERRVTGYFRAKETRNSRAEQFYGEFTDRGTAEPLADFINAVRTQIDEWGHTLDESDDSMDLFQALGNQRHATVPGSEKDLTILKELASDREVTAVGVSGANAAVGLLQEFADQYSVAISNSTNTDALSEFDIVIVTGRHQGIEPLGQTTGRWKKAKQSLKKELVGEEINSIKDSVRTLKRDFGMSSGEIQRKVPGLEASSSGGGAGSKLSGSASTGEKLKRTLLSPQVGKYMFIGAIVLIVLIGGLWGAGTFLGIGPLAESHEISGTVYNADGEPAQAAIVEIKHEGDGNVSLVSLDGNRTPTGNDGEYRFELEEGGGNYTITVTNTTADYDPKQGITPPTEVNFGEENVQSDGNTTDSNSGFLSNLPVIGSWFSSADDTTNNSENETATENGGGTADDGESTTDGGETQTTDGGETQTIAYVEGTVVNQDGEAIKFVNVTALDQEGNELTDTQNESALNTGKYRVENIPFEGDLEDGELVLKAEKEGQIETTTKSIDLTPYNTPEDGITSGTEIEVVEP